MKVVLFCGGFGTRLREHSETIPKPMVDIGYRPMIWHLMRYYAHFGHKDFILCLGYRGDYIKNYFLNYNECLSNNFVLSNGGRTIHLYDNDIEDWRISFIDTGLQNNIGQRLMAVKPYETAKDWEQWLVQKYQLNAQPTDGKSLSHTPSESIDLIQAHKVLPGQPSLVICCYFEEMARVARTGGKIVFDIVTEECLDDATLKNWFATGSGYQHYPCLMPKQYTIDFLSRRGCAFVGSFFVPMEPGKTECMVFAKQ